MRNLLAQRSYKADLPEIRLNNIWHVDADETYSVSRHRAPFRDFIVLRTLAGRGRLELFSGKTLILEANSFALLAGPDVMHYAAMQHKWEFYWFEFGARQWKPDHLNQVYHVPVSTQERVELERCFLNLGRNTLNECIIAESLFCYLLGSWLLRMDDAAQGGVALQKILALLEMGRREHIGIPELARRAGMCERSFRGAVQNATGLSPKAYMLKSEMAAAMELIRTTSMSISEIAACLDYSSPFYFSRVFKKYYGISPQYIRDKLCP